MAEPMLSERGPTGAGTIAPPKPPETPTPPNTEKKPPVRRRPWNKARIALAGLAALGAVETAGAVVSEQTNHQPVSAHTIVADIEWPLDIIPNLLGRKPEAAYPISNTNDRKPIGLTDESNNKTEANQKGPYVFDNEAVEQKVKAGPNGNAQPVTKEQIQKFLNQKPPVLEKARPGEPPTPRIQVLMPVNLEDAKVSLKKKVQDNYMISQEFYIEGNNTPFYIPLIGGAEGVEAKTWAYGAAGGRISTIDLLYTLNNGQIIGAGISFWDQNFTPTDVLIKMPAYDPNVIKNTPKDTLPTQSFDLTQNPNIDLFHVSGKTKISMGMSAMTNPYPIVITPFFIQAPNGKILYSPSSEN